ncbi:MAG: lipoprotein [Candidatus Sedimenticola sp. PURPLELP]
MQHCWPSYLLWLVIAVLGTGSMLSACGQKGDLYLPDETVEQTQETEEEKTEK